MSKSAVAVNERVVMNGQHKGVKVVRRSWELTGHCPGKSFDPRLQAIMDKDLSDIPDGQASRLLSELRDSRDAEEKEKRRIEVEEKKVEKARLVAIEETNVKAEPEKLVAEKEAKEKAEQEKSAAEKKAMKKALVAEAQKKTAPAGSGSTPLRKTENSASLPAGGHLSSQVPPAANSSTCSPKSSSSGYVSPSSYVGGATSPASLAANTLPSLSGTRTSSFVSLLF